MWHHRVDTLDRHYLHGKARLVKSNDDDDDEGFIVQEQNYPPLCGLIQGVGRRK